VTLHTVLLFLSWRPAFFLVILVLVSSRQALHLRILAIGTPPLVSRNPALLCRLGCPFKVTRGQS